LALLRASASMLLSPNVLFRDTRVKRFGGGGLGRAPNLGSLRQVPRRQAVRH